MAGAKPEANDGNVLEDGATAKIKDTFAEPGVVITGAISRATPFAQQAGFGDEGPKTEITAIDGSKVDGQAGSQYTADSGVRFAGKSPNVTGKQAQIVAGYSVDPETVHAV